MVLENLSAHRAPEIKTWLAHPKRARWHLHFTPTSSSWLNLVEGWCKLLTERRLPHGVSSSVEALREAIELWAEHWNEDPKPFVWRGTPTRSSRRCGADEQRFTRSTPRRTTCARTRRTVRMSQVALRPVEVGDLDAIFAQMRDPESVRMAAFTPEDPNDRSAFDAHMAKVMSSSEIRHRAIIRDSRLVGTIASYVSEGATEVTYWIDRTCWGQGIATRALRLLLEEISVRPIRARAASDNSGSLRVLQKAGFHPIGTEVSFAPGRAAEIEETILELP